MLGDAGDGDAGGDARYGLFRAIEGIRDLLHHLRDVPGFHGDDEEVALVGELAVGGGGANARVSKVAQLFGMDIAHAEVEAA